jgi:TRAP transporter TAXI family solute receptor
MATPLDRLGSGRDALRVWLPALLLTAAGFVVAYQFVEPAPPDSIVLATGSEQGAYHAYGLALRERLLPFGLDVVLRPTAGSVENLALLRDGRADVAFVQGGTVPPGARDAYEGLAGLYYEPLWVFHRATLPLERLAELAGRRLHVGAPGSGTAAVSRTLLAANGVGESGATYSDLPTARAVDALLAGELDAMFLVGVPRSEAIARLLAQDGRAVHLLSVTRALAYERNFRYLRVVVLGRGALDLAADLPDRDVQLLAPTAALLATPDLHPALAPLFIEAAREVLGPGGLFEATDEFPSPLGMEVPVAQSAERYFRDGPSFLYRALPFGLAAAVDRLKILLLPLLTLLLPLLKIAPPLYRWRIRSKVYRWYKVLRAVEARLKADPSEAAVASMLEELADTEREVDSVRVPPGYLEEYYNLRMHLERVSAAVARRARKAGTG